VQEVTGHVRYVIYIVLTNNKFLAPINKLRKASYSVHPVNTVININKLVSIGIELSGPKSHYLCNKPIY